MKAEKQENNTTGNSTDPVANVSNTSEVMNLQQRAATFIVDSDNAMAAWTENRPGNDYSIVYIKAGYWYADKEIDLTAAQTKQVYAEPGNTVYSSMSTYGIGYTSPVEGNEYGIYGLNIIANPEAKDIFVNCCNLYNCTGEFDDIAPSDNTIYKSCKNLIGCRVVNRENVLNDRTKIGFSSCENLSFCNADNVGYGYSNCQRLNSCITRGCYGFYNCEQLTDCVGNTLLYNGFRGCQFLTNCISDSSAVTSNSPFNGCNYLSNCKSKAGSNGFFECKNLTTCIAESSRSAGYYECKGMVLNRAINCGYAFETCYVTEAAGASLVGSTYQGGFNV